MVWPERPDNWRLRRASRRSTRSRPWPRRSRRGEPVTMAVSAAQAPRPRPAPPEGARGGALDDDSWMRDIGPTFVVDGSGWAAGGRLALQRLGRPRRRPLLLGPGRPASAPKVLDVEGAALPRAARPRGRLDPRRRRGHAPRHRGVPAQREPQPGADGTRSAAAARPTTATSGPSGSAAASSTTRPTATSTTSRASPARASSRSVGPTTATTRSTRSRSTPAAARGGGATRGAPLEVHRPEPGPCDHGGGGRAASTRPRDQPRRAGDRLAGSYVNFYIANGARHRAAPGRAHRRRRARGIAGLFPDRTVVGVAASEILLGGGNIHCITQQVPAARP